MAASLGSLVVSLGLDAAEFVDGLSKSEYQARKFVRDLSSTVTRVAGTFATIGAAAAGAIIAIDKAAGSIAIYKDLEEQIGSTAEDIAGLQLAADLSGTAMESVASASVKLTSSLAKTDDEAKGAGAALAAINIPLEEFKALDPVSQLEKVAQQLAKFEDGAGKTAVAVALFGKSGAELIPFLNDIADVGARNTRLTQEQIEAADAFTKQMAKLRSEAQGLARQFIAELIPAASILTTNLTDVVKQLMGANDEARKLQANNAVKEFARDASIALATVVEAAIGVAKAIRAIGGSFESVGADISVAKAFATASPKELRDLVVDNTGPLRQALDARNATVAEANQRYIDLWNYQGTAISDAIRRAFSTEQQLMNKFQSDPRELARRGRPQETRPTIDTRGLAPPTRASGGAKDDPTKKLLDNRLREIESAIDREKELLSTRNRFIDLYNGQSLLSIDQYFGARQAILDEATQKQVRAYDEQIEALRKYQAAAGKETDRADAQGKINDLLEKRAKLEREAGEQGIELAIRRTAAEDELRKSIANVNAQVLELTGNLSQAAAIRFDSQNEGLKKQFTAEGNQAALDQLDTLRKHTIAQADFGAQAEDASRILGQLANVEDRIQISRELGATSELRGLQQLGEARKKAAAELESIVAAQEAVAKASENPRLILAAEQARVALDQLKASADPVADKFRTIFEDAAGDAFADFITGAKSAKEAFNDFATSVISQISRIVAQNLTQELFSAGGSGGIGSTIGTFFSGLFGGGMAIGGPVLPGQMYEVAENRPEVLDVNGRKMLLMGNQRGRIDPNPRFGGGGGNTYNTTINVPDSTTRVTGAQLAADMQRKLSMGSRNT